MKSCLVPSALGGAMLLRTEPQGLEGENASFAGPSVPKAATVHSQQPSKLDSCALSDQTAVSVEPWRTRFLRLLNGKSDCAILRKAGIELPEIDKEGVPLSTYPETHWTKDWFECLHCGEKTRSWIISQPGRKECICRDCFPKWSKFLRCKQTISSPVATGEDGGAVGRTSSGSRRYFLKS